MGSDSWLGAETGVYFSTFFVCNGLLSLKVQYHMFSLEKWRTRYWKKKKINRCEKKKQDISLGKWFAQSICTKHICIVLLKLNQKFILVHWRGDQTCSKYEEKICKANYYIKILQGTDLFHLKKVHTHKHTSLFNDCSTFTLFNKYYQCKELSTP